VPRLRKEAGFFGEIKIKGQGDMGIEEMRR